MALRPLALHLEAGHDLRRSLEDLATREQASGFVLSVVGNLEQARFACPGRSEPTTLRGELEIISLQGTIAPQGVHLHLSLSDGECQVWGGHLEHGSRVLRGADLLVGLLEPSPVVTAEQAARITIAVAAGCPWSARALRMLRTLAIPFDQVEAAPGASVPQIHLDGRLIGGYDALAELHGQGALEPLRRG
jgi:predicted DNA-binding protein with PD1-like motif/glutaredoxin